MKFEERNVNKFLAIFASLLMFSATAFAFEDTWLSSNTATADTTKLLCSGSSYLVGTSTITTGNKGIIHGLCIGNGVPGEIVTVYNSSASATNPIFAVSASTMTPCSIYDVAVSSGLTYSKTSTANVTFLYQCY